MKFKFIKKSLKTGFNFGSTSGIITTLGLMVGLNASTHSKTAVISGILTIAITDALSDAFGMHISEESEGRHSVHAVWQSTFSTLFSKFIFGIVFLVPFLFFDLKWAVPINIILSLLTLIVINLVLAAQKKTNPWPILAEHIGLAVFIVILTNFFGGWISSMFGKPV